MVVFFAPLPGYNFRLVTSSVVNLNSIKADSQSIAMNDGGKSSQALYNCFVQSIPETTLLFFQEYALDRLDPERDGDLVIERLLAYGIGLRGQRRREWMGGESRAY